MRSPDGAMIGLFEAVEAPEGVRMELAAEYAAKARIDELDKS